MPDVHDGELSWFRSAPDVQLRSAIDQRNRALEVLRGFGLTEGRPRKEVLAFAGAMETKLRENDYRGGWQEMTPTDILYELYVHADKLADAMTNFGVFDVDRVIRAAADVANFAMFAADVAKIRTKQAEVAAMMADLDRRAEELKANAERDRVEPETGERGTLPTGGGVATPDVGEGPARRDNDPPD